MTEASNGLVLVVDDDPDVRECLAEILREEGYQVTTAANGADALEALRGGCRPSLMLLDLMMPVMDGWQLLAKLRTDECAAGALPVVVLSAAGPKALEGLDGAASACVPKPIDVDHLIATIGRFRLTGS